MSIKISQTEFIQKAQLTHGKCYDYTKSVYLKRHNKVIIICKEHGEFLQTPNDHYRGSGCPKCEFSARSVRYSKNTNYFINKAREIHGSKYDYDLVDYVKSSSKVLIICPSHGKFQQTPNNHITGKQGCPKCRLSKGELAIKTLLVEFNIKFEEQKFFLNCKNPKTNKKLPFDFYLPEHNICIEFDGKQHFEPWSFTNNKNVETMKENFINVLYRDNIKTEYCKNNNIELIRVPYNHINKIRDIIAPVFLVWKIPFQWPLYTRDQNCQYPNPNHVI